MQQNERHRIIYTEITALKVFSAFWTDSGHLTFIVLEMTPDILTDEPTIIAKKRSKRSISKRSIDLQVDLGYQKRGQRKAQGKNIGRTIFISVNLSLHLEDSANSRKLPNCPSYDRVLKDLSQQGVTVGNFFPTNLIQSWLAKLIPRSDIEKDLWCANTLSQSTD